MPRIGVWIPLKGNTEEFALRLRRAPGYWLPPPAESRGPGHWAVELHAGPVSRVVTCMIGEPAGEGDAVRRRVRWTADPEPGDHDRTERALPSFEGALTFRTDDGGQPEIHLEGSYRPPRGSIGAALTPAQTQQLAEASAERFLTEVGMRVGGVTHQDDES